MTGQIDEQVNELEGRLLASQKQLEDLQRVQKAFNDHQVELCHSAKDIPPCSNVFQLNRVEC